MHAEEDILHKECPPHSNTFGSSKQLGRQYHLDRHAQNVTVSGVKETD